MHLYLASLNHLILTDLLIERWTTIVNLRQVVSSSGLVDRCRVAGAGNRARDHLAQVNLLLFLRQTACHRCQVLAPSDF